VKVIERFMFRTSLYKIAIPGFNWLRKLSDPFQNATFQSGTLEHKDSTRYTLFISASWLLGLSIPVKLPRECSIMTIITLLLKSPYNIKQTTSSICTINRTPEMIATTMFIPFFENKRFLFRNNQSEIPRIA
jgi:hypothetical protein